MAKYPIILGQVTYDAGKSADLFKQPTSFFYCIEDRVIPETVCQSCAFFNLHA